MRTLLLCPPDHYGIEYEINPWMDRTRGVQANLAQAQWRGLKEQLLALGCRIELVEPQPKLPDMVFTANAGLVAGNTFIRSNFRFEQRRGEQAHFEKWFSERGYEVVRLPEKMFFEGEGDALFYGDILFCGYRFRSDIQSHQELGRLLKCLVISVELVEDRFYHLDTCFVTVRRNRVPLAAGGGEFHGTSELAGSRGGRLQPLGLGGGLCGANVSFQPLGVSCQMSLLGWLGSRRRMSWR